MMIQLHFYQYEKGTQLRVLLSYNLLVLAYLYLILHYLLTRRRGVQLASMTPGRPPWLQR